MRIPAVLYANLAALALPVAVVVGLRRDRLTAARKWILAWCVFELVANLLSLVLALKGRNNYWLIYVVTPIAWAIVLWAFALWQNSRLAALALRLLVPLLWLTWIGIVLVLENTRSFPLLAEPFAGLLVLGTAIYTLVSRSSRESRDLLKQDWFWVSLGMALEAGAAVALPPTAHWLIKSHPELVARAYEVRALFSIVALLAITRGVTCPTQESRSGGYLSRGSSPSPSSSSVSSSPS